MEKEELSELFLSHQSAVVDVLYLLFISFPPSANGEYSADTPPSLAFVVRHSSGISRMSQSK
jgi:hypothetical protein